MKFNLNEVEQKRLSEFKNAVKELYGEYGFFDIIFTQGSGIGQGVSVRSHKADITKDITDYDSW